MSNSVQDGLTKNLAANGMTVEPPNPELLAELQAIGATMVDEWLEKAGEPGAAFLEAYNQLN